jgi:hypothetical protein
MLPRFYKTDDELEQLRRRLKLTPCPHCKAVGTLIFYGWSCGWRENDDFQKERRGRRIFCNNRKQQHKGCGRTSTIWFAGVLKYIRLGASTLWTFFTLALQLGDQAQALRQSKAACTVSCAYRLWKLFSESQSHLRTALAKCCPTPKLPNERQPEAHVVAHLKAAFPNDGGPISAFQHQLQIPFFS